MSRDLSLGGKVTIKSDFSTVNSEEMDIELEPNLELQFYETVNNNPSETFEIVVEKCLVNCELLNGLANHLNYSSSWEVCRKVFTVKQLNKQFVEAFYIRFIPIYLKKAYSWLSIHLLIKARTVYAEEFKKLLRTLITSMEVPTNVLNDYIANVSDEKRNELMKVICSQRLTNDEFKYHLTTLNLAFLGSEKSAAMCQYIVCHLVINSIACSNNKDYGKLLLSFLENYRRYPLNRRGLTKLVNSHESELKGPCMAICDEIMNQLIQRDNQRAQLNNNLLSKFKKFEDNDVEYSRSLL